MSNNEDEPYTLNQLLRRYFFEGYTNLEICSILRLRHEIRLSERHARRCLNKMNLFRRRHCDLDMAVTAIQSELQGNGRCLGYRAMQQRILSVHGISVPRDTVADIQRMLDSDGVRQRRQRRLSRRTYHNKGPNYLIHVDGYDKLKRFGFAIHGAICGFSRRVLWFRVGRTNNDPKVIAIYFLDYVIEIEAVPRCIRCDDGTENCVMEDVQRAFRWDHTDDMAGYKSCIRGSSPSNQRIERWWRSSRDGGGQFWIDTMKELESTGALSTCNTVHIECARFCFMEILQADMLQTMTEWNQHRIRRCSSSECPSGKPNLMYHHPVLFDTVDYKIAVNPTDIQSVKAEINCVPVRCDQEFSNMCHRLMGSEGRIMPTNKEEAVDLYVWLCSKIE